MESVELFNPNYLPIRVFGVPVQMLSPEVKSARNEAAQACFLEALFCSMCLPLGAARAGLAKLNLVITIALLVCALIGLRASLGFHINWVLAHCALVIGIVVVFFVFMVLAVLFGSGTGSEYWIICIIFAGLLLHVAVARNTYRLCVKSFI